MTRRRNTFTIIAVLILAFVAVTFVYPDYFNKGIDYLNKQLPIVSQGRVKITLPHFPVVPFRLGLDLKGGSHLVYEADLSKIDKKDYQTAMQGLRDVIEKRVNYYGIEEPLIQTQEANGHYRLIVEIAGVTDINEAKKIIGETPFLEFKEPRSEEQTKLILDKQKEIEGKTFEEIQKIPDWQIALEDPYFVATELTGKYLTRAEVTFDSNTNKPQISLQFNDEGSKLFESITERNVGKLVAITLNQSLLSAPVVQEKISGGKAQITGKFTIQEAQKMVRELNAGALPVPINLVSQEMVGPTLGQSSLNKSLVAGLYGFIGILVFVLILYRIPGLLAAISLIIYGAIILAVFKLISATMTLAGIAGFILSIGMAVDANVLIFARIREEIKAQKSYPLAVKDGFDRAWPSIRDSNMTTLITSVILFSFGTSFVKGFAVTLIIGLFGSLFASMIITRIFMELFVGSKVSESVLFWEKPGGR